MELIHHERYYKFFLTCSITVNIYYYIFVSFTFIEGNTLNLLAKYLHTLSLASFFFSFFWGGGGVRGWGGYSVMKGT